jgi:S-adenosylmethionine:tRNA ribosyltransferase-isomerase
MRVSDFDYELPEERIAERPLGRREDSRLMVLRASGRIEHRRFDDLPELLRSGDLLVLNDTRVLPARLTARKTTGGRVELLLLEREEVTDGSAIWVCLAKAARGLWAGARLELAEGLAAVVLEARGDSWRVRFEASDGDLERRLQSVGGAPLPPYIKRPPDVDDLERYQTVYARNPGAVAAPTAGLHFSDVLLGRLESGGIERCSLTLHVGPGTFRPVRVERVEDHRMEEERFVLPEQTAAALRRVRAAGGRIAAVGTTVVRTLESRATEDGTARPGSGRCGLFIHPGFRFRVVDLLITNFHLPRSTLLMLVAAFAGRERLLEAYRVAIAEGYRFYSYGDAMLVEPAR